MPNTSKLRVETVKGIKIGYLPPSWWFVFYDQFSEEWVVQEVLDLPEKEDLSYFKNNQEDAIELARELNSEMRRRKASEQGKMIRYE